MTRSSYASPWPYTSQRSVCMSYAAISRPKCLAKMESSTAPPQCFGSWIHAQYSALGLPRNPSLYVNSSPETTSAMTLRRPGASRRDRRMTYPTALNRQLLSESMTTRTASVRGRLATDAGAFPESSRDAAIARAKASSSSMAEICGGLGAALGAAPAAEATSVTVMDSPFVTPTDASEVPSSPSIFLGGKPAFSSCAAGATPVLSNTVALRSPTVASSASSAVC
mmetsp:Transcript_11196/g.47001  ORF Transcript_11196/g.47001 Transcript_11196/m.47001 type:complete len:225 (+) Transcript_11196:3605-4279(+)